VKKVSLFLWILLVSYTLIYGFSFGFNSELLPQLFQGQADGFSTIFFNWMGLVPFYFLIDASLDQDRPLVSWIPLGLGFALGAYSALWGYRNLTGKRLLLTLFKRIILSILLIGSGWLWIDAIINTNPSIYFSHFFHDAMVGIMTVDFLILYGWSLVLAKSRYQAWWLSLIPMIGFGLLILFEDKLLKPSR
jgi:hypothetical protein